MWLGAHLPCDENAPRRSTHPQIETMNFCHPWKVFLQYADQLAAMSGWLRHEWHDSYTSNFPRLAVRCGHVRDNTTACNLCVGRINGARKTLHGPFRRRSCRTELFVRQRHVRHECFYETEDVSAREI